VSFKGHAMHGGASTTAMKEATSCFQEAWVMLGCPREFQPQLIHDDVEDLVDREVQRGEGGGVLGLHHFQGSVLRGSWGPLPLAHFLELSA